MILDNNYILIHLLFWRGLQSVEVWAETRLEAARTAAAAIVLECMVADVDYTVDDIIYTRIDEMRRL